MTRVRIWLGLAAAASVVGVWFAFNAPVDALQGEWSRILNVHVPSWWNAFLAFGITALGSIMWLIRKRPFWDQLAEASVEIGVLFTGLGLFTGMVWGHGVWGVAWDWGDARLTTSAVLFFVYLAYLALRRVTPDPVTRARRSAILGVIAVIQVPLVYFSVNLFRTLHQTQSVRPGGSTMPDEMLTAMLINVGVFTLIYLALTVARLDLSKAEERADSQAELAGDAVKPPQLSEIDDV